jgi:hypothetical protein
VFQSGSFGPIRVYKRARPADAPHPIMDPEQVYKDHHATAERRAKSDELERRAANDEQASDEQTNDEQTDDGHDER